jgi:CHASE3 domain sensor protein
MTWVTEALKDATYVTVGLGVLGFQRAQVRRHELTKQLKPQIGELVTNVDQVIQPVRQEVEQRLDQVEDHLGGQAREVVRTARAVVRETEQQLRRVAGAA